MATEITPLTRFEGTDQSIEHGGVGAKINELIEAQNGMVVGQAVIAIGEDDVTILAAALGGSYEGSPAMANLNFIDATALYVKSAVWSGDDLVITVNANATADTALSFMVDARA